MKHVADVLDAWLDADCPPELARWVDEHMSSCAACQHEFGGVAAAHKALLSDARSITTAPAPLLTAAATPPSRLPNTRVSRLMQRAAAVMLLLTAGFAVGRLSLSPISRGIAAGDSRFLLLLAGSDAAALTPERRAEVGDQFRTWTSELDERGMLVSQGQLTLASNAVSNPDTPPPDSATLAAFHRINGYFIINAATVEQADSVARTMPYLDLRGWVLVRPIATGTQPQRR